MSRPRRDDPRQHQLNVRFTAYEFARIHHHASLTGKTVTDFGRAVMLRRPRPRRKDAPALVALPNPLLARWQTLGLALKAFIGGYFVLDASERRRLDGFESTFGIPVWYACFPPAEPRSAYLFRNRDLMGAAVIHDPARQIIRASLTLGFPAQPAAVSFALALLSAGAPAFGVERA